MSKKSKPAVVKSNVAQIKAASRAIKALSRIKAQMIDSSLDVASIEDVIEAVAVRREEIVQDELARVALALRD